MIQISQYRLINQVFFFAFIHVPALGVPVYTRSQNFQFETWVLTAKGASHLSLIAKAV